MDKKNIAIVGATGLVGRTMLKVLEERNFPINNLKLYASARSAGKKLNFAGKEYIVEETNENSFQDIDIALFSAGKEASKKYAPIAASNGCVVIDNSSAWRMDTAVPLVVPEVNKEVLKDYKGIIANPNCSTIQLMLVLKPLQDNYGLKRVVASTYQSISGAGQSGIDKLMSEIKNKAEIKSESIAYNTNFHTISDENGFTEEEIKMINETRKILDLPDLPIAVTCVRLPILGGHGESVNVELNKEYNINDIRELLARSENLILMDKPLENIYPTPAVSKDKDEVFVGRLRIDNSVKNGLYFWVVADNIRKGAATNAVQIAELYKDI